VKNILKIENFLSEGRVNPFYSDELNPDIWEREEGKGKSQWVLEESIRKKLLEIGEDFFSKFKEIFGEREYKDIILTGSLANYNYTEFSDFDVHVMMDLKGIDDDIKIKGYEVELFLQSIDDPDASTATYSLVNNSWIKYPKYNVPSVDELELERKYLGYVYDINQLETRLLHGSKIPSNSKELYKRAKSLKEKIQKMRGESLKEKGEFSIGNLTFKKLRSTGYIEKIINIITRSYDKIFSD